MEMGYQSFSSILSPGFDSMWGANFSGFNGVIFLVVGDVPIDNEAP
jgi:hypothetical protein